MCYLGSKPHRKHDEKRKRKQPFADDTFFELETRSADEKAAQPAVWAYAADISDTEITDSVGVHFAPATCFGNVGILFAHAKFFRSDGVHFGNATYNDNEGELFGVARFFGNERVIRHRGGCAGEINASETVPVHPRNGIWADKGPSHTVTQWHEIRQKADGQRKHRGSASDRGLS